METNKDKALQIVDERLKTPNSQMSSLMASFKELCKELIELAATPDELPTYQEQIDVWNKHKYTEGTTTYPEDSIKAMNAAGLFIMSSNPPVPDYSEQYLIITAKRDHAKGVTRYNYFDGQVSLLIQQKDDGIITLKDI